MGKMWAVEDVNSEGKAELRQLNCRVTKKVGGAQIPRYSPQAPLPILPLLSSALLLVQHAQKRHTKVEGREGGGMLTKLICCFEHYNGLILYFITDSDLLLASFSVGFLYILEQKLIFSILTHNPNNHVENV